jgi:tetratricopeptide (TPR) repeat protein
MFENWGMYEEAVSVYQKVLAIKEEEPQSYRDLALAYEKSGDLQTAIELLYACLTKDWYQYENRYRGLRSLLLTEMNSIIKRQRDKLDLSVINSSIVKPLPVDLRIVVDWNKDETDIDLHIVEPGGEECYYNHRQSKAGEEWQKILHKVMAPRNTKSKRCKRKIFDTSKLLWRQVSEKAGSFIY